MDINILHIFAIHFGVLPVAQSDSRKVNLCLSIDGNPSQDFVLEELIQDHDAAPDGEERGGKVQHAPEDRRGSHGAVN